MADDNISYTSQEDEYLLRNDTPPLKGDGKFNGSIYEQEYWIQCEAALSLLTAFALYAFCCMLRYTTTKKSTPSRDTSGKQGKRLYVMLTVASGFAVLRMIGDHVVAFTSYRSDAFCYATIAASTVLYALGLMSVYIFLWMRQSIFYANPVLAKVLNKGVTIVSWSTLAVMLLSGVSLTVLYNVPEVNGWDYQVTEDGCKGVLTGDEEVVAAVATATTVYFQISLLGLFLYPLLSRKTQKYRSAAAQNKDKQMTKNSPSSISNTDDNLTDGGGSTSNCARFNGRNLQTKKNGVTLGSENESGVYVQGPSDSEKTSESMPNEVTKGTNASDDAKDRPVSGSSTIDPTEKTKLKTNDQKRPSIFNAPRFFKTGSLFYRRNPKRNAASTQSPTAKRSRDRILSSISQPSDNEGSERGSKRSEGTQKKKKQRNTKRTKQGRRMMAYLKKSFYMMMVCVVTDIACTVVQAQVNVPELVYLVIFDLNLMINVICIAMSFRDWDVILFPMCARSSQQGKNVRDPAAGNVQADLSAAKRRAEVLRSVTSRPMKSSPSHEIPVRKVLDLNGKT